MGIGQRMGGLPQTGPSVLRRRTQGRGVVGDWRGVSARRFTGVSPSPDVIWPTSTRLEELKGTCRISGGFGA